MNSHELSNDLRRFIHTIISIPHLEGILLLQQNPGQVWNITTVAQRIYISQTQATNVLKDLCDAGICQPISNVAGEFSYSPAFPELGELINQLADYYPRHLIEVTNMIHSKSASGQRVRMFADAFKIHKDK